MQTFQNHFKKNTHPDDSNKNIDEWLVEKNYSITSDDESEFYSRSKECNTEAPPVNQNDDVSTLTDALDDLTISESVNSDISNPTVLNNTLTKVRSTDLYHNPDHNL